MKKILITTISIIAVLLLAISLKLYHNQKSINDAMINELEKHKSMNICVISATQNEDMWTYSVGASGVVIGRDSDGYYALTANHVVNDKKNDFLIMTVSDPDYSEYRRKHSDENLSVSVEEYYNRFPKARVVYTNEKEDLAIIYFETTETLESADISRTNPKKGEPVITIGTYSEKNEHFYITTGKIKKDEFQTFKTDDDLPDNQVFQHSAFTSNGFSGGGVFDKNMNLIGINIGGGTGFFGDFRYSAMIPCEQIQKCIAESHINEPQ